VKKRIHSTQSQISW